jgi:hypothetical protein
VGSGPVLFVTATGQNPEHRTRADAQLFRNRRLRQPRFGQAHNLIGLAARRGCPALVLGLKAEPIPLYSRLNVSMRNKHSVPAAPTASRACLDSSPLDELGLP